MVSTAKFLRELTFVYFRKGPAVAVNFKSYQSTLRESVLNLKVRVHMYGFTGFLAVVDEYVSPGSTANSSI
jgi:hypothetical protein